MAQWFSCNSCSGSDPTSDTVKVDASLLAAAGKENVQPTAAPAKAHELQKAWEEQDKRVREQQAEKERQQLEEQAKRRREEEEAERRRQEEMAAQREAAERERMQREAAAEAAARAREEQLRLEEQRAAEERAHAEREAAEKAAQERTDRAVEKVTAWCKKKGFQNMNAKASSLFSGSKYALHVAVADKDAEMVGLMVLLGVDKTARNSKGQTAEELAMKLNKKGSMDAVLASLR